MYELVNEQEIGRKVKSLRRTEVEEGGRKINTRGKDRERERSKRRERQRERERERERERANCIKKEKEMLRLVSKTLCQKKKEGKRERINGKI